MLFDDGLKDGLLFSRVVDELLTEFFLESEDDWCSCTVSGSESEGKS